MSLTLKLNNKQTNKYTSNIIIYKLMNTQEGHEACQEHQLI